MTAAAEFCINWLVQQTAAQRKAMYKYTYSLYSLGLLCTTCIQHSHNWRGFRVLKPQQMTQLISLWTQQASVRQISVYNIFPLSANQTEDRAWGAVHMLICQHTDELNCYVNGSNNDKLVNTHVASFKGQGLIHICVNTSPVGGSVDSSIHTQFRTGTEWNKF